MEKVSCFNCVYHPMCRAAEATREIPFDTNSVHYSENHKKLYEAIATICGAYKGK